MEICLAYNGQLILVILKDNNIGSSVSYRNYMISQKLYDQTFTRAGILDLCPYSRNGKDPMKSNTQTKIQIELIKYTAVTPELAR